MPVPKGLEEAPDVVARGPDEPFADAAVNACALLLRKLASRSTSDQVVGKPERTRGFDGYAAPDELTRCLLSARFVPPAEVGGIRQRQRTRGDREKCEQRGGVGACTVEARGDQLFRIDVGARGPHECLEPERRSA